MTLVMEVSKVRTHVLSSAIRAVIVRPLAEPSDSPPLRDPVEVMVESPQRTRRRTLHGPSPDAPGEAVVGQLDIELAVYVREARPRSSPHRHTGSDHAMPLCHT